MTMQKAMRSPLFYSTWAVLIVLFIPYSQQLQSSQFQTLLRIQKLLEFPKALDGVSNTTDFCGLPPSPSLTVVCHESNITELLIVGEKPSPPAHAAFSASFQTLSPAFSADSLFTTLTKLYGLRALSLVSLGIWGPLSSKMDRLSSLEMLNISSNFIFGSIPYELSGLSQLRRFIMDDNMLNGSVPDWFSALPGLEFLSLKDNRLNGHLPSSLSSVQTLKVLVLSGNNLSGDLPDLSTVSNLQVLILEDNKLGPNFPILGKGLVRVSLSSNRFSGRIPSCLKTLDQLQHLDMSFNALSGLPPPFLFSLPAIRHLNLARNSLCGTLPPNLSCGKNLGFADISANFLSGELPSCLMSKSSKRTVNFTGNCLVTNVQPQQSYSYCQAAQAAHVSQKDPRTNNKISILIGIVGGTVGGVAALVLVVVLVLLRRSSYKKAIKQNQSRKLVPDCASTGISSELLVNARCISQAMKLGSLGLPQYRPFALEEIEEATNNFDESTLLGEGSNGKLYRGRMEDGTLVAIRCLRLEWRPTIQNLKLHMELFSKLRHQNLVSLLGHCIDCELDGSNVKRIFLIFEYVSNGTLQSYLSGNMPEKCLTWPQRLTAVSGVARAIHFLHTGVVPGIFNNNVKITNVLLHKGHVAKLSDYGLPGLTADMIEFEAKVEYQKMAQKELSFISRKKITDKTDIYSIGLILLEAIVGRLPTLQSQEAGKVNEMMNLIVSQETRRNVIDPSIISTCVEESLAIVVALTAKCLSIEPDCRPSMEDVLWNLQYAAQVQDTSADDLEFNENHRL